MPGEHKAPRTFTVLFVCTGNICRSAFAQRLGQAYLDEKLGGDAGLVRLSSAGTRAVVGSGMHPGTALVLQGFGGEPDDFTARQLDPAMAADADLVLGMTRAHRREVLHHVPRGLARTFTLREAADLLSVVGDRHCRGGDLLERSRDLVRAMASARPQRQGSDRDDIPDPIDLPVEAHQAAGDLIAEALIPLLARIVSLRPHGDGSGGEAALRQAS